MKKRKLGWTDLELSVVGLGCWSFGGGEWKFGWGPQDDELSIQTVYKALDSGINWIDTAPVYGLGHSEKVVGKALKGMKEKPIIATKCSRRWTEDGEIYGSLKSDSIRWEVEQSLQRLGVEVIDLYQVHNSDPDEDIEEGWETIQELIKEGKIRYAGVSNFNVEQMERCQNIHRIASDQPLYNMLQNGIEKDIIPYAGQKNMGLVVYSPLCKGMLTGKVTREWIESLPDGDHRKVADPVFTSPHLDKILSFVDRLQKISDELNITTAQLAVAWTLRKEEVTSAIVGARKPAQAEQNAGAGKVELTDDVIEKIQSLRREYEIDKIL